MSARHCCCKHCGQDIEGFWPYRKGEWRDRGNNTTCPSGYYDRKHHPYEPAKGRKQGYKAPGAPP